MSFFIYSSGQDLEIITTSNDSLDVIDIGTVLGSHDGTSYPVNDSLGYTDDDNLKQGVWGGMSIDIGNCTNSRTSNYEYYKNGKLLMSFLISHDNNACYPSQTNFLCRIYDDNGNVIYLMNNTLNDKSKNDYLWQSITATKSNQSNGYRNFMHEFAKVFFEENTSGKRTKKMKLTYLGKKIPGEYSRMENE